MTFFRIWLSPIQTATFPLHSLRYRCRSRCSAHARANPHLSVRMPRQPKAWWRRTGSNRRPDACKATALPAELRPLILVGLGRLERPTSPLSGVRSNHLSYRPRAGTDRQPLHAQRCASDPAIRIEKEKRGRPIQVPPNETLTGSRVSNDAARGEQKGRTLLILKRHP